MGPARTKHTMLEVHEFSMLTGSEVHLLTEQQLRDYCEQHGYTEQQVKSCLDLEMQSPRDAVVIRLPNQERVERINPRPPVDWTTGPFLKGSGSSDDPAELLV